MTKIKWLVVALVSVLPSINAQWNPNFSDLPPGPYCGRPHTGCCIGRRDACSAPLLDTRCYCDDFCNRTISGDCCPDFLSYCKGLPDIPEAIKSCHYNGKNYAKGSRIKKNCHTCTCEPVGDTVDFLCDQKPCMIEERIVETVNQMQKTFGWTALNYSTFWGRTLEEGIQLRLGTLQPHRFVRRMSPVRKVYDPYSLPKHFDANQKWPGFIGEVKDQGWCGSSWALSTVETASDRYAIVSKGLERISLSAQNLLSCNNRGQQSCHGGYLDKAWLFLRKYGVVDEDCYPYTGNDDKCRIPRLGNLLTAGCTIPYGIDREDKYKVGPAYRVGNETDIMYEIMQSGPVQATMKVYHDFFSYSGGIYRHTALSTIDRTGYHSVKIIGWGEESDNFGRIKKFWKIANSWGENWGENGFFRIVRGTNECDIESFVLAAWPLTIDPTTKSNTYHLF